MEAVKKYWIWGIFISILAVFAMSHNANAIELVIDLNQYSLKRSVSAVSLNCTITNGFQNSDTNVTSCSTTINNVGGGTHLDSIETTASYSVENGDLISFYFFVWTTENYQLQHNYRINLLNGINSKFSVISYKEVTKDEFDKESYSFNGYLNSSGSNYNFNADFYNVSGFYKIYNIVLRANQKGDFPFGLTAIGTQGLLKFNIEDLGMKVNFRIVNFSQYTFSGSESNKEQEEKTQEAVNESEAAGGDSSSAAQSGTTGLLNAITGAVSVISSASPTNCKINGNMGNLDMGQLDLCANPAPAFIQTIGSLILILMCVPLAISLFNRFISIFRSFQS